MSWNRALQRCSGSGGVRCTTQAVCSSTSYIWYFVTWAHPFMATSSGSTKASTSTQAHKRIVNVVAADEALQLTVDALAGHFPQEALAGDHSVEGGRVDGHAELGGEATGSQDAQCIFGKARRRIAHAAQHAALHVVQAVEGVDDPARGMVGQGVYGEVPPLQILFYRGSLEPRSRDGARRCKRRRCGKW